MFLQYCKASNWLVSSCFSYAKILDAVPILSDRSDPICSIDLCQEKACIHFHLCWKLEEAQYNQYMYISTLATAVTSFTQTESDSFLLHVDHWLYLLSASARSDVPKVSSQTLPLMEFVSFLLRAVNVYINPFSSISSTASGNSSSILSATRKLGTKGFSPPSGGGISQKSITFFGHSLIWSVRHNKVC